MLVAADSGGAVHRMGESRLANDADAFAYFTARYDKPLTTKRTFEREVRRFRTWLSRGLRKNLRELTVADMEMYREFLKDPQPYALWCATGKIIHSQRDKDYRPFNPPAVLVTTRDGQKRLVDPVSGKPRDNVGLSNGSIAVAMNVVSRLFTVLIEVRYLPHNPMSPVARPIRASSLPVTLTPVRYALGDRGRAALVRAVEAMPERLVDEKFFKARARLVSQLIGADVTRMPIAGLLRMKHLASLSPADRSAAVLGDGVEVILPWRRGRRYSVRGSAYLRQALIAWRDVLALPAAIAAADDSPLIPRLRDKALPISERQLRLVVSKIYRGGLAVLDRKEPDAAVLRMALERLDNLASIAGQTD